MNKNTFAAALLLSALPLLAQAGSVSLNQSDFRAAESVQRDGKTVVRVKLSKSGKAKLRKLSREAVGEPAEAGGVSAINR